MKNIFDLLDEERERIAVEHKAIDPVKEAEFWRRYAEKSKAEQERIDAWMAAHPDELAEIKDEDDEDDE